MAELGHRRDTPLGVPASSCQKRFHLAKYPAWKLFSVPQFWEQSGKHLNKTWGERLRKALLPSFELGWFDCPRSAKLYVARPHLRITARRWAGMHFLSKFVRAAGSFSSYFCL